MINLKGCTNRAIAREKVEGHAGQKLFIRKIRADLHSEEKNPLRRKRCTFGGKGRLDRSLSLRRR